MIFLSTGCSLADYREDELDGTCLLSRVGLNCGKLRPSLDKLKNVGEAVIIDIGEGRDIHPRNKQIVANRLVRHALARITALVFLTKALVITMEVLDNKIILTFDHVGQVFIALTREPTGLPFVGRIKILCGPRLNLWAKIKSKSGLKASKNPQQSDMRGRIIRCVIYIAETVL